MDADNKEHVEDFIENEMDIHDLKTVQENNMDDIKWAHKHSVDGLKDIQENDMDNPRPLRDDQKGVGDDLEHNGDPQQGTHEPDDKMDVHEVKNVQVNDVDNLKDITDNATGKDMQKSAVECDTKVKSAIEDQQYGMRRRNTASNKEKIMPPKSQHSAKEIATAVVKKPVDFMKSIRRIAKATYRALKSTVGLLIILGGYSVIGAFLFQYLEGQQEETETQAFNLSRDDLLKNFSSLLTQGESGFKEAKEMLMKYEEQVKIYFDHGLLPEKVEPTWTFIGSLVYCITVYTTIGYGHIAPNTAGGKAATIVYALIGIPLCLIILADLGKLITRAIKFVWAFIRRFYYTGSCVKLRMRAGQAKFMHKKNDDAAAETDEPDEPEVTSSETKQMVNFEDIDDEFNLPVPVALFVIFLYLLGGTFMYFGIGEDWGYLDAVYFVFISVSTIGFGDILPANQTLFLFSMFYIFIGLSLISMTINVFIEFFDDLIDKMKAKAGNFAKNKFGIDFQQIGNRGPSEEKELSDGKGETSPLTEDKDHSRSRSVSVEAELPPVDTTDDDASQERSRSRSISVEPIEEDKTIGT